MIAHLAGRIGFVALGFVAGVAAGTASFFLFLTLISLVMPDGGLWDWLGLGPVLMIAVPLAFFFSFWLVAVSTFAQAALANLVTEFFVLRALPVHLAAAVIASLSGGVMLDPWWFAEMTRNKWLITLAAIAAALVGGLVHWAIAGRNAGLKGPHPALRATFSRGEGTDLGSP